MRHELNGISADTNATERTDVLLWYNHSHDYLITFEPKPNYNFLAIETVP